MTRDLLDRKVHHMLDELLLIESMVENSTIGAVEALKEHDLAKAKEIYLFDQEINARRFDLENQVIITIATQQPIMAGDLRLIASILEIVGELERMGDYAKGICVINLRSEGISLPKMVGEIYSMAERAVDMLHRAMTAFAEEDIETAKTIIFEDDLIGECYARLYNEAVHHVLGDPRNIECANYVIWAAHNLERLADRVTNICERVIYIVTGERPELDTGRKEIKFTVPEHKW